MSVASTSEKPVETTAEQQPSGEAANPAAGTGGTKTAPNGGLHPGQMILGVLGLACLLTLALLIVAAPKAGAAGVVLGVLVLGTLLAAVALHFKQDKDNSAIARRLIEADALNLNLAEESNANRRLALDMQTSEERYRSLSAASPLGIFEMDAQGNCLFANDRFQEITGQTKEEYSGRGWSNVLYNTDKEPTLQAWEEAARAARSFERDVRLVTQQGVVRWVQIHANPLPARAGDMTRRFVGTIADITERKRAEDGLRTSEMRFRSVVESAMDGILLVDGRGTLLSWNQGAQQIFGYTEDEAIGRSITFVLPNDFRESYWQGIAQVQVREGVDGRKLVSRTVEVMGVRRDGTEFPLEISLSAYRSGDEVFYSAVLRDISERQRADQMRREKDIAEKANRTKSQFLANMSHELRTPLNAIIGFSEILQDRTFGDLNNKQSRYVDNILNSGRHLLQLINDILDLSKIEAGRMELEPSQFTVSTAVNDVYNIVKGVAMKKEVTLIQKVTDGMPSVNADQSKFKQILYNLISNAIKFTPEGKNVTVTGRILPDAPILEITVKDEGIGIKKEDQERIFGEFEQVDNSFSRKQQGTGLGLALTKRFVELHGGKIWVQSEGEGKGSTFGFTIPVDAASVVHETSNDDTNTETTPAPAVTSAASDANRPTVLVIEDDKAASELLTHHLQEAGYNVATAADGETALAQARTLKPFAITLDVMLPQKDGWQVLSELKAHPETENIPVVVVSMTPDRELAFSLGAVECFVKPVDKNRLMQAIQAARKTDKETTTVLVVDDNADTVEMLSETLSKRGFNVLAAHGGQEGIEKATADLPDIIVLDLMMPNVSGFEVVKQLNSHPEAKNIPVLIYTANEVTDEARAELSQHVTAIMPKKGKVALLQELDRLAKQPKAERSLNNGNRLLNGNNMAVAAASPWAENVPAAAGANGTAK
jgi:PAS domain S-box-containing protein